MPFRASSHPAEPDRNRLTPPRHTVPLLSVPQPPYFATPIAPRHAPPVHIGPILNRRTLRNPAKPSRTVTALPYRTPPYPTLPNRTHPQPPDPALSDLNLSVPNRQTAMSNHTPPYRIRPHLNRHTASGRTAPRPAGPNLNRQASRKHASPHPAAPDLNRLTRPDPTSPNPTAPQPPPLPSRILCCRTEPKHRHAASLRRMRISKNSSIKRSISDSMFNAAATFLARRNAEITFWTSPARTSLAISCSVRILIVSK